MPTAGFSAMILRAPRRLVEAAEVDCLTLEYLAELTMSILARRSRQRHADAGFTRDWLEVLESLTPAQVTTAAAASSRTLAA
ncbi:MAG: acyclic terpene utilization AtuA family protein [Pirellulaceae bacterium]